MVDIIEGNMRDLLIDRWSGVRINLAFSALTMTV